jgi:hypothetical protein
LNQSTLQSAKVITESLGYLKGLPDAQRAAEVPVEDVSGEEPSESEAEEACAQPSADESASGEQAAEVQVDPSPDPATPPT